jgi:hypothetical protein
VSDHLDNHTSRKGKLITSIMPELNRSDSFLAVAVNFGETDEDRDSFATTRWSTKGDDDLIMCLAYLFKEEWVTPEMIERALFIASQLDDPERSEDDRF